MNHNKKRSAKNEMDTGDKKQAFKEGNMDNTVKLNNAAKQKNPVNKNDQETATKRKERSMKDK